MNPFIIKRLFLAPLVLACAGPGTSDGHDVASNPFPDSTTEKRPWNQAIIQEDRTSLETQEASSDRVASLILLASPSGDLSVLDPADGSLLGTYEANAVDIAAWAEAPHAAIIAEGWEDGSGSIRQVRFDSAGGLHKMGEYALSLDDLRLIHGPEPMLGLGIREGTTIFCGEEGRTLFGTSSFVTFRGNGFVDTWLLEHADSMPTALVLRYEQGFRELERFQIPTPDYPCPSRFVREAPTPLIIGVMDHDVWLQHPSGEMVMHRSDRESSEGCVQDALWIDSENAIAVLTGPDARFHLLSVNGYTSETSIDFGDRIGHDPHPQRRFAYDGGRKRLWMALDGRLVAFDRSVTGFEQVDLTLGYRAKAVAIVW
ncbi:MAG TPA: hypothetical protein PLJ27_02555 [Polyangiaceae bacterium]|nr:MAG: hypothetical protein BWY17_03540 [Deltaproteobacteria bacterium ADurb.Bin207]HNS95838.1 hypothetical protein [Polyangiaceae bacterium]HNZ21477.1 hypothetical protein [Polyangiaceae bacterium]HOD23657.1 hypothetical protein [Polyangiaceae bacterium]HOE50045.1 hypothetical protein [Polyangiaceae bacterium]